MGACAVLTQHIWAGEHAVTQRTKLKPDAVCWDVFKSVDEGGEGVQCRGHVHCKDLVLRLRILHHEFQDSHTLR